MSRHRGSIECLQLCRGFAVFQLLFLPFVIQIVNTPHNQTECGNGDKQGAVFQGQLYGIQAECAQVELVQHIVIEVIGGNLDPNQRKDGAISHKSRFICRRER